ncbi:MAG: sugar phosphate isomerase/epimerase [Mesorhizobium sp.]|uniref:sugar phosphate isomerase/epimerase family protein n=1 Tax=Mesorhizobium sp. TaxID=1871066 RepID=UPI000FEA4BD1|nr:sugar phosphate isomerase/epimerase [Mesorhizobium sp.]RWO94311.1 MAG: sugar phosphate isomerase/epimerase [Mesorhizobium sp.]
MELRSAKHPERSIEENIDLIATAGYDGVSADWGSRDYVRHLHGLLKAKGLTAEGQCYPDTVDELKPVLENATEFGVHHLNIQPNAKPRKLKDCVPLLEGWQRLAEQVDFPVYFETHRDRMTTDLYFTLDLLEAVPSLRLLGDISHFVVGREFAWPISAENHGYIHQILAHCWAFHGRVATREQVQIEITFPQHQTWLDQFLQWWEYGFRSWRKRSAPGDTLAFTCELGPKPYAITGRDGEDTTDRWSEALLLRERVAEVWMRSAVEPGEQ